MPSVEDKILQLGMEEYINCFLVSKSIRDGYLFQTINYKEYDISDPISYIKLKKIKEFFPNLHHLQNQQGILISKQKFSLHDIDTDTKLGKILGFPCELPTDNNITKYTFDIIITHSPTIYFEKLEERLTNENTSIYTPLNHNSNTSYETSPNYEKTAIITFVSPNLDCIDYADYLANTIRETIINDESGMAILVHEVEYNYTKYYPVNHYIYLLIDHKYIFSNREIEELSNYWYNSIGDYRIDEFKILIHDEYVMSHAIVRGLLIGLLTYCNNCPLDPFCPLQNYGVQKMYEVEKKNELWADELLQVIECHSIKKQKK